MFCQNNGVVFAFLRRGLILALSNECLQGLLPLFLQTLGFARVFRRYNGALVLEHPRTLRSASANLKIYNFTCLNKTF